MPHGSHPAAPKGPQIAGTTGVAAVQVRRVHEGGILVQLLSRLTVRALAGKGPKECNRMLYICLLISYLSQHGLLHN